MPLSRHRAKRLGREHGRKGVEQAQDAARDFLRIALAEGIYELEKDDLSNDEFDELLVAAARKMPAVVQAAARRAVYDAIRETDPSSYSIIFNGGDERAGDLEAGAAESPGSVTEQERNDSKLAALKVRAALLDQQFVTREEAATVLSVSVDTIDRLCKKGKLKRKNAGRQPYVITKSILNRLSDDPAVGPVITDGLTVLTGEEMDVRQKLMKD